MFFRIDICIKCVYLLKRWMKIRVYSNPKQRSLIDWTLFWIITCLYHTAYVIINRCWYSIKLNSIFKYNKGIFDKVYDLTTAHIAVCLANGILGIIAASTIFHGAFSNCRKTILIYLILVSFLIILIFVSMFIGAATLNVERLQNVKRHHACDENRKRTVSVTTYVVVFDSIDFFMLHILLDLRKKLLLWIRRK